MLMSMGAVIALLLTLAAIDDRVREQLVLRMGTPARASAEIVDTSGQMRDLAGVVYEAVRDQSIEHAPMVTFVLAGVVFLIFMLRT
jgi:hypothetical protein